MATLPEILTTKLKEHYSILDFDGVMTHLPLDWEKMKVEARRYFDIPKAQNLHEIHQFALLTNTESEYYSLIEKFDTKAAMKAKPTSLFKFIKQEQIHFSVCSNNTQASVNLFLDHQKASILADIVVGIDSQKHAKPHPQGLQHILNTQNPVNPVYIGDKFSDYLTALAAKIPFIHYIEK